MPQKYKVFIDGCAVFFLRDLSKHDLRAENCLAMEVNNAEELESVREVIRENSTVERVCLYNHDLDQMWAWFTSGYKIIEAAGGLVHNHKGEVLCIHRRGMWDLPKGKIDAGETAEEAAIREVEEECGIKGLELGKLLTTTYHTYEHKGLSVLKPTYWYAMRYAGEQKLSPQQEEDIEEARWVGQDDLSAIRDDSYTSLHDVFDQAINRPKL